jgi:hypothetical protein
MSDKPSYLGLLNAIAVAERDAGEYLRAWAAVTPSDDVRRVIHTISLRESEHGLAFAKRIDELGYEVIPRTDPKHDERMSIAASTTLTDREKFERLRLTRRPEPGSPDVFDRFFENKDLDPVTGGLLGRYVAEERDSGRRFAACYASLPAPPETSAKKSAKKSAKTASAKKESAKKGASKGSKAKRAR